MKKLIIQTCAVLLPGLCLGWFLNWRRFRLFDQTFHPGNTWGILGIALLLVGAFLANGADRAQKNATYLYLTNDAQRANDQEGAAARGSGSVGYPMMAVGVCFLLYALRGLFG
ncbi:MAG TPA: hypothetical protein VN436_10530 [Holophaga sp.]|nr:hypothetical protein [Holophaga sp.]